MQNKAIHFLAEKSRFITDEVHSYVPVGLNFEENNQEI